MSKYIDIDNEEEILKECDFDYFYNSENCSSELCSFYNDTFRNGNSENFDKRQALIDLGRIGIVLNNQSQQIAKLKAENKSLKKYETIYYLNQLQASNEDIDKFKQNQIQQSINISDLLKDNTKQVCDKIRNYLENNKAIVFGNYNVKKLKHDEIEVCNLKNFIEFLDQIENDI